MAHCDEEETVQHFLLDCPAYAQARETVTLALTASCTCSSDDESSNCAAFFGDLDGEGQALFMMGGPIRAALRNRRSTLPAVPTWTSPGSAAACGSRPRLRLLLLLILQHHALSHSSALSHNILPSLKQATPRGPRMFGPLTHARTHARAQHAILKFVT